MNLFGVLSEVYPTLLTGLTMTVKITILSLIIALVIGIFVCLMNISSNIVLRGVLYLADSWYSDAGAGILFLFCSATVSSGGYRLTVPHYRIYSQFSYTCPECRRLYF